VLGGPTVAEEGVPADDCRQVEEAEAEEVAAWPREAEPRFCLLLEMSSLLERAFCPSRPGAPPATSREKLTWR